MIFLSYLFLKTLIKNDPMLHYLPGSIELLVNATRMHLSYGFEPFDPVMLRYQ
jgi:hypothetical protein